MGALSQDYGLVSWRMVVRHM